MPCSIESSPAAMRPGSASSPNTCAATRAPSSCARATAAASTSSGKRRSQIAGRAVDPVGGDLDPAICHGRLAARPPPPARTARSRCPDRGCNGGSGRCADRPGSGGAGSDRPGRKRLSTGEPASTQEQRAGHRDRRGPARPGPSASGNVALRLETDVTMRVDEAGDDPPALGDRVRAAHRCERQSTVDDPGVALLLIRQETLRATAAPDRVGADQVRPGPPSAASLRRPEHAAGYLPAHGTGR